MENLLLILFSPLLNLELFIITFFLHARISVSSIDPYFLACNPKSCGDSQNITYPFFIEAQQEPFCGYPGFGVFCSNGHPNLRLQNDSYIIHQISYETNIIRVSNAPLFNKSNTCVPPFHNTSFSPDDRFKLNDNQSELVLLYHCNTSQIGVGNSELIKYKVDCLSGNWSNSTLSMFKDDPLLGRASSVCENAAMTAVDVESGGEIREIEWMLKRGFLLNWVASNCSECQRSGGKCGFDNDMFLFRCFCPDGPHAWHCVSGGDGADGMEMTITATSTAAVASLILFIITLWRLRKRFSSNRSLCWKTRTQEHQNIEEFLRSHGQLALKRYKYSEVKKMTGSFNEKLGQGGYGAVFKGELPNGCLVAVKLLKDSKSNGQEFINEVASISRTSHVNIVTLLGFCFEGSKRALVYEFITNGSLEKYVCKPNVLEPNHQLGWEKLFDIAVGVAQGLEYLHRGCNTRILHFDIKPHNILLDENFRPKISDFGLAKICTKRESIVSMIEARGTIGYIAPEVFCRNFGGVSHKSDVYSYGMLVLDIVGGRKNTRVEVDNSSEMYFPDWIYKSLNGDEGFGVFGIDNEVENQIAKKLVLVSLWCIQAMPSNRPTMSRVVEMLQGSFESLPIPPRPDVSSPSRPISLLQSMADS